MAEQTQTNITAYGRPKSSREGGSTVINYTVNGGGYGSSNINARSATINRIKSELIDTNILNAGTGNFVYLVATDGTISTLRGTDLNYQSGYIDELQVSKLKAHELTMNEPTDIAKITTIFNEYLQGKEIVTDYLTVNKAAHFFEVVIDKIKSVGGTIINTACNSTIDYVQGLDANDELTDNPIKYRCYFKRTQDDGTHITNDWMVNDQAICQACNLVPGASYDKGTHYYWRLVVGRNNEEAPVYVNFNTGEVDDESTTQPDYFVVFKYGEGTSVIFTYDKTIGNDGGTPVKKTVTAYTSSSDIATDMTVTSDGIELKIEDTIHGLTVLPDEEIVGQSTDVDGIATNITQKPVMMGGGDATFSFETMSPTRLNVAFVFDDGTIEFHPIGSIIEEYNANHVGDQNYTALNPDTDYLTEYSVGILSEKNINFVSITSDEVNVWNSCHWIDLGNGTGEYDIPQHIIDDPVESDFNMAPVAGDNIVQLGYRYTQLPGYENTQAWKDAHVDEVSRASAIIIAAYKTPDGGGTVNGRVIKPIVPPSYAQYQNITSFSLYAYRGTYMDASGGYFKGNLVSESGDIINIDDQLSVDVNYYQIVPQENPITAPQNSSKYAYFKVLHVYNGVGSILDATELNAEDEYQNKIYTLKVNNTRYFPIDNQNYFRVTINAGDSGELDCKLYLNNVLKDEQVLSIIDFGSVTDGVNGNYSDFVYKGNNSPTGAPSPLPANEQSSWDYIVNEGHTNGWSKATPTGHTYIWMTQRDNVGTQSGWNYGDWQPAIRITGEDGKPGKDSQEIEFIYLLSKNPIEWSDTGSTGINPHYWNAGSPADRNGNSFIDDDYLGPTGISNWVDNPIGVSNSYMYEYVSQRLSTWASDGVTSYWNNSQFTTPALWSKYGQEGKDGDGVEYIFASYHMAPLPEEGYPGYDDNAGKTFTEDDFYPAGWYDDPVSPTVSNPYVFVSQRKQTDGKWITPATGVVGTPWSTPAIWSKYSKDGNNGATGSQGEPGDNGIVDKLVPVEQLFEVRTTSTDDYSGIVSKLYANLRYKVYHVEGDTVSPVTGEALSKDYSIRAYVRTVSVATRKEFNLQVSTGTAGFRISSNQYMLTDGSSNLYMTNMLEYMGYPESISTDYRTLSESSQAGSYLPIEIRVELLVKNPSTGVINVVTDTKTLPVIFKAGHVFEVTDSALNTAFFGSWNGSTGIVNGMASLRMDMQGIETNVSTLQSGMTGLQSDYSAFKQSSTQFQTKVESDYYTATGAPSITYSVIDQRAGSISASTQTDIQGRLLRTGIDIQGATGTQGGTIKLQADKVTFSNSAGTITNKISIDPTTGTLKATDGNFSGTVNAATFYSSAYNIPSTVSSIDMGATGTTIYNQYLKQGQTSTVTDVYLPDPLSYNGLEIKFFCFTTSNPNDFIGDTRYCIRIHRPSSGDRAALRVRGTSFTAAYFNKTQLGQLYVGTRGTTDSAYEQIWLENIAVPMTGADYIDIMPNTLCTMKSISGRWYQITGANANLGYLDIN